MKNVNITNIREKLSDYISYVLSGGTVLLWRQKKRVAKIVPYEGERATTQQAGFDSLCARGLVSLGESPGITATLAKCPAAPTLKLDERTELTALINADREER